MSANTVSSERLELLCDAVDRRLVALNERFLLEVPDAAHLTGDGSLDATYYIRHRIETIKRIRMTARTDALALAALIPLDYDAARAWADYACEELGHDLMFYDDLVRHGVSRESVDAVAPFAATVELGAFLEAEIVRDGPLAAIAYSVFVEWNSQHFSRRAVDKARMTFGDEWVRGSSDHLEVDEGEDHTTEMLVLAERLTRTEQDEAHLFVLIERIAELFRAYFNELAQVRGNSSLLAA